MQTKAFTVYLPEAVHEQLRTQAFTERTSINKLIIGMVTGTLPPLATMKTPPARRKKGGQ